MDYSDRLSNADISRINYEQGFRDAITLAQHVVNTKDARLTIGDDKKLKVEVKSGLDVREEAPITEEAVKIFKDEYYAILQDDLKFPLEQRVAVYSGKMAGKLERLARALGSKTEETKIRGKNIQL